MPICFQLYFAFYNFQYKYTYINISNIFADVTKYIFRHIVIKYPFTAAGTPENAKSADPSIDKSALQQAFQLQFIAPLLK